MRSIVLLCTILLSILQAQQIEEWVHVPIKDWQKIIDSQPKGVQLSYEEYLNLLSKTTDAKTTPVNIAVKNVEYRAKIYGNILQLQMAMSLENLSDNMQVYEFEFGQWGISQAQLNNADIPVFIHKQTTWIQPQQQQYQRKTPVSATNLYRIFVHGRGEHHFSMTCHTNIKTIKDEQVIDVHLGKFAKQTLTLDIDPEYTYASTPGHRLLEQQKQLQVYLGQNSHLQLSIQPKQKKDQKTALETVHITASHLIDIDTIASHFVIDVQVYHKPLKTFELLIPKTSEIINISEPRWDTEENNQYKTLVIQLEKELLGEHRIEIDLERQLLQDGEVELPKIQMTGTHLLRQDGIVYVERHSDIKVELRKAYLTEQMDLQEVLPRATYTKSLVQSGIQRFSQIPMFAMKYWNNEYSIVVEKHKIVPRVESSLVNVLGVYENGFELVSHVTFDVREGEKQHLVLQLPKNWSLTAIQVKQAHSARHNFFDIAIPDYYLRDGMLHIPLLQKISQGQRIKIQLSLQWMPDKWQDTSWQSQQIALPFVVPQDSEFLPSFMGIISDSNYQISDVKLQDVVSVDPNIIRSLNVASDNLTQGYKINSAQAQATLKIQKNTPKISVVAAHYVDVDAKRVRYATVLTYEIKNAPVDTFRFGITKSSDLYISDEQNLIKEKRQSFDKEFLWIVMLQKKVMGTYSMYLTHEVPIQKAYETYQFPKIVFKDVENSKGYIAIQASSMSEVTVNEERLDRISPKKIPVFAHPEFTLTEDFAYALKYVETDYLLNLSVGTHESVGVAEAIINSMSIRTIFPGTDIERVECEYSLSHLRSQFFEVKLPEKSEFWSAVVDGEGAKPHRIGERIAIPVKRQNNGSANHIKLIYERKTIPLDHFGQLQLERPQTGKDIPVRVLHWSVYLPQQYQISRGLSDISSEKPWYKILGQIWSEIAVADRYHRNNESQSTPVVSSGEANTDAPFLADEEPEMLKEEKPAKKTGKRHYNRRAKTPSNKDMIPENQPKLAPPQEKSSLELRDGKSYDLDRLEGGEFDELEPSVDKVPEPIEDPRDDYGMDSDGEKDGRTSFVDLSKVKLSESTTLTVKAKGLKSIDIDLTTQESRSRGQQLSVSQDTVLVNYIHSDFSRSIEFMLLGLATFIGVILLSQHRWNRLYVISSLLLIFSFIPHWVGMWSMVYCNALVWGVFLSVALRIVYISLNWFRPAT